MSRLPQHCDHKPNSIKDNQPRSHNLDIRQYSLDEIYALFGVKRETLSIGDLKKAKQRVLMTHPDKSGMPSDYFIFYKKALEVLATDYAEMHRVEQSNTRMTELQQNNYEYTHGGGEEDERMRSVATKASTGERFQRDFNRIFEEQMQQKIKFTYILTTKGEYMPFSVKDENSGMYYDLRTGQPLMNKADSCIYRIKNHQELYDKDTDLKITEGYKDLYTVVMDFFNPKKNDMALAYLLLYVVSMAVLAFHLWHGFASGFQSLGLNHKRYTPIIQGIGKLFALAVPGLFALITILIYLK
jgi:hypothetical protein